MITKAFALVAVAAILIVGCQTPQPDEQGAASDASTAASDPEAAASDLSVAASDAAGTATGQVPTDTMGYVLFPDDGEVLVPCREESSADARWVIKADPVNTGSMRMAMGTQALPGGEMIPVHRHEHQDEILFIHEGEATGVLGDSSVQVVPGTTVYVPRGVWHGVRNTESETVSIVWVVSPPGLEGFFRDIGVPEGGDCVPMEAAEMEEIRRQHGITQRIE